MNRTTRGTALLAIVVYLGIVSIFSAGFFRTVNRIMDDAQGRENRTACRYIAEGGVEATLARLATDPAYSGEADVPLGDGTFTVRVEPTVEGAYRIVSTGSLLSGESVRARLTVEAEAVVVNGRVERLCWIRESVR